MPELLDALRNATGALHEALHRHPLLLPLHEGRISLEDYKWCIRAFHMAHARMREAAVYVSPFPGAPALEWLEADMRVHGIAPGGGAAPAYPAIDSRAKSLGCGYVREGSTLGGRVISRHLRKTLGLEDHVTNHFFAGWGEETGARWKAFLSLLDDGAIDMREASGQAVQSFLLIARCCDAMLDARDSPAYSAAS